MTRHNNPDPPPLPPASSGSGRRRLLKGALGALPAVYTLPSGAQTSMTSVCGTDQAAAQETLMTEDRWTSQQVMTGTVGGQNVFCVPPNQRTLGAQARTGDSLGACVQGGPFGAVPAPSSQWVYADGSAAPTYLVVPTGEREFTAAPNDRYGMVYVDESGRFQSFRMQPGQVAGPAASACVSINPMAGIG